MKFVFNSIACCMLLTVIFTKPAFGQIFNVNADTVVVWLNSSPDSIYVFRTTNSGTLKAKSPVSGAAFQWAQFDTINKTYKDILGSTDSIVSNLPSGGYQVHITATGYDRLFKAWVYVDKIGVSLEKDNGNIRYYRYTCDYTDIIAKSNHSNFVFYNTTGVKQALPVPKYRWWSVPNNEKITSYDYLSTLRLDTTRLPIEKAVIYVEATDVFGLKSNRDSVKYSPIICKAIIDTTGGRPVINNKNSAPFTISFLNKSKNAVSYTWFIQGRDSVLKNNMDSISPTFYITGKYRIRLEAQSLEQCTDTAKFDLTIANGQIGNSGSSGSDSASAGQTPLLPDVFVPGSYNYKIYNISIRQFRFTIYSRWGKKVYEIEGPNMLEWEGWNGDINGNGPKASDGIYYYVLEVMSWDKTPDPKLMKPKGKYSGFFYLFRQK